LLNIQWLAANATTRPALPEQPGKVDAFVQIQSQKVKCLPVQIAVTAVIM
jgi:hypothetical protein